MSTSAVSQEEIDACTSEADRMVLMKRLALAKIKAGGWLEEQTFAPVNWFVDKVIPEGYGLLTGPPKIGKSWLVLDLALAVVTGGKALGGVSTTRRPVLYLALEDGDRRMQVRARELSVQDGWNMQPIPKEFQYATDIRPDFVMLTMEAWLDDNPGGVIFLDTLGKVMPPQMQGESAYQRDYRIGGELKRLVGDHPGSGILVVHHTRKGASEDWMDSTSGTNGLNGAADYTLNLARDRGSDEGVLRGTGRDTEDFEYALTFADGRWSLFGGDVAEASAHASEVVALQGVGDTSKDILRVVAEHPDGIGPGDVSIALASRVSPDDAGTYLRRLAGSGRIRKIRRGVYAPADENHVDTGEMIVKEVK